MPDFVSQLRERAAHNPRRIVFPESTDARVLKAVARLVELRVAPPVLVGWPAATAHKAKELGVNLSHAEIIDARSLPLIERYSKILLPDWRSRGVTEIEAQRRLENPLYFAAAMVRAGDADGFVGGA